MAASTLDFRPPSPIVPRFPYTQLSRPGPVRLMLAFSTCWNSYRHVDGYNMVSEIILLGFEAMEISHGTNISLFPGILQRVEEGSIKVTGVHNFCPSPVEVQIDAPDAFEFTSHRATERQRALKLTRKSIDTAVQFGGAYVVMHLGGTAIKPRTARLEELIHAGEEHSRTYVKEKLKLVSEREAASRLALERIRQALDVLVPYAEEKGVRLAIESRSHYEQAPTERELRLLLEEYPSRAVGYWHDFGHVQRKVNLGLLDHAEWLREVGNRLLGCHLHDVVWPEKDHHIPFHGAIDYDRLIPLLPDKVPVVWEINPRRKSALIKEALVKWKERFGN